MERHPGVFTKPRQRNLAGRMADDMDLVGPAVPRDLSMARDLGGGSRAAVAGDRWSIIYRYGAGRTGIGRGRPGVQLGHRRPLWPWRCHGHLVSGALHGLWQQPVGADVGTSYRFDGIVVSSVDPKKIQRSVDSLYSLSDGRISDPKKYWVDGRVKSRSYPKQKGYHWGKYLRGSFTIEAALLVPLILGILFLLLQTVVTLHDRVREEAYQYEEWCCNEQQDSWRFVQIAGAVLEEWEEWKS